MGQKHGQIVICGYVYHLFIYVSHNWTFNQTRGSFHSVQRNLYKELSILLPTKFRIVWLSVFGGIRLKCEKLTDSRRRIRIKNCCWHPCLLTDQDEINNLYTNPSIDASYQVSVLFAEWFQRRKLKCKNLTHDGRQVMTKAHIAFGKVSQRVQKKHFFTNIDHYLIQQNNFFSLFIFHVNFFLLKKSKLKYISTRI